MTEANPAPPPAIKVAIVGAGPAGFFAALELFQHPEVETFIDMFDRVPTPYGLVRFGVAPDHPKIKSVTRVYERGIEAAGNHFRLFGNVELGKDVSVEELRARYHAVIFTFGAQTDRRLGVPGEDLPGVYAAREFVAWYNSHPDYRGARFDLNAERAVVIGVGNVAIDVARVLMRSPEALAATDISHEAAAAVAASPIREVVILARRGPAQAKATPTELHELTHLGAADLVIDPRELAPDAAGAGFSEAEGLDRSTLRNIEIMRKESLPEPRPGRKVIRMRFFVSPIAFLGRDRVEAVQIRRNRLVVQEDGWVGVEPTDEVETLACGAVFRSIGYQVAPVPGVPYDGRRHRIPHRLGQVLDAAEGEPVPGLFVAGWAKRGPSGVIGTNKPDAVETVRSLLGAWQAGALPEPGEGDVAALLDARGVHYVDYDHWKLLDQLETSAGEAEGRPRVKFPDVETMLEALADLETPVG